MMRVSSHRPETSLIADVMLPIPVSTARSMLPKGCGCQNAFDCVSFATHSQDGEST